MSSSTLKYAAGTLRLEIDFKIKLYLFAIRKRTTLPWDVFLFPGNKIPCLGQHASMIDNK